MSKVEQKVEDKQLSSGANRRASPHKPSNKVKAKVRAKEKAKAHQSACRVCLWKVVVERPPIETIRFVLDTIWERVPIQSQMAVAIVAFMFAPCLSVVSTIHTFNALRRKVDLD